MVQKSRIQRPCFKQFSGGFHQTPSQPRGGGVIPYPSTPSEEGASVSDAKRAVEVKNDPDYYILNK